MTDRSSLVDRRHFAVRGTAVLLAGGLGLAFSVLAFSVWAQGADSAAGTAGSVPADLCGNLSLADEAARFGLSFDHLTGSKGEKHLPETMGAGLAWLDFDGDGWIDLYLVQSGPFPPPEQGSPAAANQLWRNLGGERFERVRRASPAADSGCGQGAVAADVDGDGDLDLYVTNYGADRLWINRGDGQFEGSPVGVDGWSSSAAFADADADGDLDLYVSRYVVYDPYAELFCGDLDTGERAYCDPSLFVGAEDRFLLNRGDGTFAEATEAAGLAPAAGRGLGVLFTDFDGDGRPDLYVANDLTTNGLYRNRGDGTFDDESLFSGAAVNAQGKPEAGMGLAVGDLDGDGKPDLAVTNFDVETNTLYRNLGEMQFEDFSVSSGFGLPSFNLLGFGLVSADFDLDGDVDFYVANGHIFESPRRADSSYRQHDLLLLGDGQGSFTTASCGPAFDAAWVGRGLAAADFDNDGDVDLALINSAAPAQLLVNSGAEGGAPRSWLGVRLVGAPPNGQAIGARVTLTTTAGRQSRWVVAGDSYQSSSEQRLQFGLGAGEKPLELEVRWPNGKRQRWRGLPLNGYARLVQEGG